MSVAECQLVVSSSEFTNWIWFLNYKKQQEWKEHAKWEWYAARIAYEIHYVLSKKSPDNVDKFLLKFGDSRKESEPVDYESRLNNSKRLWKAFCGLTDNQKVKTRMPPNRRK